FGIHAHVRQRVVVRERGGQIARVRALEIVVRAEVELVGGGEVRTDVAGGVEDREVLAGVEVRETAGKGRRRTPADQTRSSGAQRASAKIARTLQHRLDIAVLEVHSRVALTVREVAAQGYC